MNRPAVILYRCMNHKKPRWRVEYTNHKHGGWMTEWNNNSVFSDHIEVMTPGDHPITDKVYNECLSHYDCDMVMYEDCPECKGLDFTAETIPSPGAIGNKFFHLFREVKK